MPLFLLGFGVTFALLLIFELEILFVDDTLFGEDLQNLLFKHLFLAVQVLDARVGNVDVNFHHVVLLSG